MELHELSPKPGSKRRQRRVGRGIAAGQGASCGKGMRGQKSRSGPGPRRGFEGGQIPLYRRIPKLKHFTLVNPRGYTTINVSQLAVFQPHSEVTLHAILDIGLSNSNRGPLKILGDGDLSVPLFVKAAAFTKSARVKIEAAGGTCEEV
ncbi:ribosomal protein L15 [Rubidibacter lacunae KORDI 51-2]|uniref:Large ribosomal subunit protein uL15 n=1 Tax=Rubidibacter lacunae KORDI 51-2 TaxID=582515 RepID=U5DN05_9CHRO|nr:50S ribosomal protein L15 [Rubidibacter lacunae]ERN42232.1 ribosomal protein L15 [Rubidibacter lacunae KORDI 51-2]